MVYGRIILIGILGFVAAGLFVLLTDFAVSGPDAEQYDRMGWNLACGRGFSLDKVSPYAPTMFREPGYPAILAAIYRIFGHKIRAVLLLQAFMHALTAVIVYLISSRVFGDRAGFLSGLVAALFPTLANISAYLLSETYFTLLLMLGLWSFCKMVREHSLLWSLFSGTVFGIVIITKAAALFLPFVLSAATGLASVIARKMNVRLAACLVIVAVVSSVPASAWSFRNSMIFDTRSIALRGGDALWSRAQKLNDPARVVAATACYSISEYLGSKLFPEVADKPERYLFKDFDRAFKMRDDYRASGFSDIEIDKIFRKEAVELIFRRPFRYVAYTVIEAIKMTAFTYLPVLNEPSVRRVFDIHKRGRMALSALRGIMRFSTYPIILLSLAALFIHSGRWESWLPLVSVIIYFNVIYSVLDAIGRYAVPLIPLYCILAVSALVPDDIAGSL